MQVLSINSHVKIDLYAFHLPVMHHSNFSNNSHFCINFIPYCLCPGHLNCISCRDYNKNSQVLSINSHVKVDLYAFHLPIMQHSNFSNNSHFYINFIPYCLCPGHLDCISFRDYYKNSISWYMKFLTKAKNGYPSTGTSFCIKNCIPIKKKRV